MLRGSVSWWVSRKLWTMRCWVTSGQVLWPEGSTGTSLTQTMQIFRAQHTMATTVCSISQVTLSAFCFLLCFYTLYIPWSFTYSFILRCHLKCFWHLYCAILIGRKAPYFPNHWQTHHVEIVHLFQIMVLGGCWKHLSWNFEFLITSSVQKDVK